MVAPKLSCLSSSTLVFDLDVEAACLAGTWPLMKLCWQPDQCRPVLPTKAPRTTIFTAIHMPWPQNLRHRPKPKPTSAVLWRTESDARDLRATPATATAYRRQSSSANSSSPWTILYVVMAASPLAACAHIVIFSERTRVVLVCFIRYGLFSNPVPSPQTWSWRPDTDSGGVCHVSHVNTRKAGGGGGWKGEGWRWIRSPVLFRPT